MDGVEFNFRLETVTIAKDLDDDDITSCIVQPVEGGASRAAITAKKARSRVKEGKNERIVMQVFDKGLDLGAGTFEHTLLVEQSVNQMPLKVGERDRRRDTVAQAIGSLIEKGILVEEKGFLKYAEKREE